MTTRNVHEFCVGLWEAREESRLPGAAVISRGLARAVAADVEASEDYEPHVDLRVVWAQRMVKGRNWQVPECRPEASEAVESAAAYLLGKPFAERVLTGRDLAAGEGREHRTSNVEHRTSKEEKEELGLFSSLMTHQPMTHQLLS